MAATSGSGSVENVGSEKCSPFVKCDHLFVNPTVCAMSLEPGAFTNYNLLVDATAS